MAHAWLTFGPEQHRSPLIYCLVFTASPPTGWSAGKEPLQFDLHSPKWISTRSSLSSGASANIRKFCTYGFVYPRSSSPSTWWWASLREPRRPITAERARARQPGISPPSPAHRAWTSASRIPPASLPMSCCWATGLSASHVATDGCTARRLSKVQQSPRYCRLCVNAWCCWCAVSVKSQMKSGSMQLQLLQNVRSCMETGGISCSIIKKKEKRINHPFTIRLDKHPSLGELLKFFKNTTTRSKLRKITGQTYEVLEPP